jgi:hypothetical protein
VLPGYRRVDLDHRTEQNDLPVRPRPRHAVEQHDVHALVDDAEEAQAGAAQRGLVRRILL